ncbi:nuclear transport factor 2 family protein [Ferrovibrio terrae]|jgi:ketosteroid isomerase-like protein|uniref:nuclear transport factor 2 family protein n=1 Tax=Ferrovibrio terrae TaxID=2594003 RepID=UPI0031377C9E
MSRDVLAAYYAALRDGDFAKLEQLVTPDVCVQYYGPPGLLPWVGRHDGFAGYKTFLDRVRAALEIVAVTPEATIAEGDWVVMLGRGLWRARASGREVQVNMTNAFRFRDGRIAEYRVYTDTAAFAALLA